MPTDGSVPVGSGDAERSWIDTEVAGCQLGDQRLGKRLRLLLGQLEQAAGSPLPLACQDWANTKAAYRFLSNERFSEDALLAGHFQATADRFANTPGMVLVVQDTTEFSFRWAKRETIGAIGQVPIGLDRNGKPRILTQCGLLMHGSLVVTREGLPLGLSAAQFWSRKSFKGTTELKRHVNPTRVPIEDKESARWLSSLGHSTRLLGDPGRCVFVGDRENDIYEFLCAAKEAGTHFLVRTCVDRLAGDGHRTVARMMARVPASGQHKIEVPDAKGRPTTATLQLRFRRIHILPPIGKQKRYPALDLTVIHASEARKPRGRARIEWKLVTDLPVNSMRSAIEKLLWYAQRWKIELFHKVLKSGCRIEAARLRTAERLTKLIAMFCILAWRVFWTTMVARTTPFAPARAVLTESEAVLLDRTVRDQPSTPAAATLSRYLMKIACLGGYLARARDPPPGIIVMWRGWSRLADMMLGADAMQQKCG
ncbi:IS4 family transposase [Paracraurococcus ruber]|uniref:IS4 family transposase n=2 Tax=Paracraurococcus ruber TaxID=77675 RepID=A0ABS1D1A6_9PROT|nr:IS4 family transposase [Paracraurococcus ruber]MBK1660600.1 IS4 family transposase [Paracraurococcus ruber]TDG27052.1 IS4 family transposase [Paracraurococcus ruber]